MASFVFVLIMIVLAGMGSANAEIYGFDDMSDPDGTPVSTCIIAGVTVTISNSSSNPLTLRTYGSSDWVAFSGHTMYNTPLDPSQVSFDRFISTVNALEHTGLFVAAQPITFTFDVQTRGFGLTTVDLLENGAGPGAHAELTAYDVLGNQLAQHSRPGEQGASGLALRWEVLADAIKYVVLTGEEAAGQGGYGIDDLIVGWPIPAEDSSWGRVKMLYR
ncbi:hypothetical protein KKG45_03005 [bacterium]|nr:hypothetical protein [bacterium]MBU1072193.1 hypothetical protein [bacterium]MBU1676443.1 hypothetical protein [bacterium]